MTFRLFQNIRQKNSFLSICSVCLIILVFSCVSFIFSDVNNDDHSLYPQISFNFEYCINSYLIEKTSDIVLPAFYVAIHGRSPPLV